MNPLASAFIGDSPAIHSLRKLAVRLANAPFPILLDGETGTGKFELALLIHERSARCLNPFVDINCAAIPETLFESVVFGHERGAFTDARERRVGRIEATGAGTLLFDEVDCLGLMQQAKLLRVLDRGRYERVGGRDTLAVKAATVFATNRDLSAMVGAGLFRPDLLQRIGRVALRIPALRERPGDIELLASLFLAEARSSLHQSVVRWNASALRLLEQHDWPGNVRELKTVVEVAAYLHEDGETIGAAELSDVMRMRPVATSLPITLSTLAGVRDDAERRVIANALRLTSGNRAQAARLLKIGRRTLHEKIAKHGL